MIYLEWKEICFTNWKQETLTHLQLILDKLAAKIPDNGSPESIEAFHTLKIVYEGMAGFTDIVTLHTDRIAERVPLKPVFPGRPRPGCKFTN